MWQDLTKGLIFHLSAHNSETVAAMYLNFDMIMLHSEGIQQVFCATPTSSMGGHLGLTLVAYRSGQEICQSF